jgi:hypothetical protein
MSKELENKGWSEMSKLLDAHLPVTASEPTKADKSRRRKYLFWFFTLGFFTLSAIGIFANKAFKTQNHTKTLAAKSQTPVVSNTTKGGLGTPQNVENFKQSPENEIKSAEKALVSEKSAQSRVSSKEFSSSISENKAFAFEENLVSKSTFLKSKLNDSIFKNQEILETPKLGLVPKIPALSSSENLKSIALIAKTESDAEVTLVENSVRSHALLLPLPIVKSSFVEAEKLKTPAPKNQVLPSVLKPLKMPWGITVSAQKSGGNNWLSGAAIHSFARRNIGRSADWALQLGLGYKLDFSPENQETYDRVLSKSEAAFRKSQPINLSSADLLDGTTVRIKRLHSIESPIFVLYSPKLGKRSVRPISLGLGLSPSFLLSEEREILQEILLANNASKDLTRINFERFNLDLVSVFNVNLSRRFQVGLAYNFNLMERLSPQKNYPITDYLSLNLSYLLRR